MLALTPRISFVAHDVSETVVFAAAGVSAGKAPAFFTAALAILFVSRSSVAEEAHCAALLVTSASEYMLSVDFAISALMEA